MKVMQVLPELHGGGVERGTVEIGQALIAHGHESHVVSAGGRMVEELEKQGVQLQPDIVHVRSRIPAWVVELAYKTLPKTQRPVRISTFHGFHSVNCYSAIMTHGDRIIAVSQTIAEHIQQAYGVPKEKIEVIYRGIDPKYFDPASVDHERLLSLRKQWGVPDRTTPVLLMPGRFTRLKGHGMLLDALEGVAHLPWHLVFVGDHDENPTYTQELLTQAKRLGLAARLCFHGQSTDMPLIYSASDLVLNVSTRPESFGRTAVEAMAMEKPVIVAGHGGGMETVMPEKTGWCFTPNNTDALSRCLEKALLAENNWNVLGRNGRRHVVNAFTLDTMCQATLSVYADCCQEGRVG